MDSDVTRDAVLTRLRADLGKTYGSRLEKAVLFGSRARNDHRTDSDYDVAVFIRDMGTLWDELGPLSRITTDILVDTGALISAKPFLAGSYADPRPLMQQIRRDGVEL